MQELPSSPLSWVGRFAISTLRTGANGLLSVAIAPRCAACDEPLERPLGSVVCEDCWSAVRFITPPTCETCADPLPTWRTASLGAGRCARCRRRHGAVSWMRAVGEYEGALGRIIRAWKYDCRRSLGDRLATLLHDTGADLLDGIDAVVPVPLHRRRLAERGFNQADNLAVRLGPPVVRALRRTRDTPSQVELPAARRHANVRDAFALSRSCSWTSRRRARVDGQRLVLIDDVVTTGATLETCARMLMGAGASEVRALTLARVVGRRR